MNGAGGGEGGWHRTVTGVVRRTLEAAYEANIPFLASAVSFDILLTAIPFVGLVLAVVGYLVEYQVAIHQLNVHELLQRFLPDSSEGTTDTFEFIERALGDLVARRGGLTLLAAPLFLWFSTRMFGGLRAALNEVFDTEENRPWPVAKLTDLAMVFAAGTLFLANAFASTGRGVDSQLGTLVFSTLLFFIIFKFLPSRRIYWRTGLVASLFCAVGFEVAKRLYTLYVAHFVTFNRVASDANLIAVLLLLLWISAGRRSCRNVRSDADAAPATGAARMNVIDLRSDTVTKPSAGMRRAMADAEVGDDVLDGDPTTRRLEQRIAELLGTEDALFFPSGTQANQTGIGLLVEQGTEVLLEANAHIVDYGLAGVAALAGAQIRPISTPDGLLSAALVQGALRPASPHVPRATALTVENTHNAAGGRVLSVAAFDGVVRVARDAHLAVHLDGARLWNAAVATDTPTARLTRGADTVMVSISKGLGCPVGSCLGFARDDRARAWEIRKRLGGGMRQSGILAAAGLYALDHNLSRICEDHENAKRFTELLSDHPALRPSIPETNIVMLDLVRDGDVADTVAPRLARAGVRVLPFGPRRLRAVTHLDVSRTDVERAAAIISETLR